MNRIVYSALLGLMLVSVVAAVVLLFPTGAHSQAPEWRVYKTENSGLLDNDVRALVMDAQGNTWIGTYHGGLAKFDGEKSWTVYNRSNSGLPNNDVWALTIDAQEHVWIGTPSGLAKFDGDTTWTVYNTGNSELPNNNVWALAMDAQENVWIGTGRGLVEFDGDTTWTVYNTGNSELPDNEIRALAVDAQGKTWIGTSGGLAEFDGANWTVYNTRNSGLPHQWVYALAIDARGNTWIGTGGGLAKFDGANWEVYNTRNSGLPDDDVFALAIHPEVICIGTGSHGIGARLGGFATFDKKNWMVNNTHNSELPHDDVRALAMDAQGKTWIGTRGGLAVLEVPEIIPLRISNVHVSVLSSTSSTIAWETNRAASGFLSYGTELGEYPVAVEDTVYETQHQITLTGLTPGTTYYFTIDQRDPVNNHAWSSGDFITPPTPGTVRFVEEVYPFTIERTYDQRVEISVQNDDDVSHQVRASVSHPYDDLILDFVGAGSMDQPVTIGPGEGRNILLVIHAQDATRDFYDEITLELRADGAEVPVDSAAAEIQVRLPVFDLVFEEVGEDPHTLGKTLRLTNRGDPLGDLTVWLGPRLTGKARLRPRIEHSTLAAGDAVEFEVVPILYADFTSLSGEIWAGTALDSTAFRLEFTSEIPPVPSSPQNMKVWESIEVWYCINVPWFRVPFQTPPSSTPANLEDAYLEVNFSLPWPKQAYPDHDVHILVNDNEVGALLNIVPQGKYVFQVNPSYIHHGPGAANFITFEIQYLSSGNYLVSADMKLLFHLSNYSMYVVAQSQEEADEFLQNYGIIVEGRDLAISTDTIEFSEAQPDPGASVIISAAVDNLGMEDAESVVVRFYDGPPENEVQIGVDVFVSVPSQQRKPVQMIWRSIPQGCHTVYVVADPEGTVEEVREDNNAAFRDICTDGPDAPPWVLSTFPGPGATNVDLDTEIRITFSEPMDSVPTQDAFSIAPFVSGSFSWPEDSLMVFTPDVGLVENTIYTVTIDKSAKGLDGKEMIFDYPFAFSTGERPRVLSTLPGRGATNVDPDTEIRIAFSKPMDRVPTQDAFHIVPDVSGSFSWPADVLMVFTPDEGLAKGTAYTVTIDQSAKDQEGYSMRSDYPFAFTTWEWLKVVSTFPENRAINVDPDTQIRITFSKSVQTETAKGAFHIVPYVSGSFSWESSARMVFTPDVGLAEGIYTVTIDQSAQDLDGNGMTSDRSFTFRVRPPVLPRVLSTFPENSAFNVDPDTEIRIAFSKPMDRVPTQDAFSIAPNVSGRKTWEDASVLVFTPDVGLVENTIYTVTIDKSAKDLAGNRMVFDYPFSFRVRPPEPPLTVRWTLPTSGAIDVNPATEIRITFSKPMDRVPTQDAFSIDPDVSGSFSWPEDSLMVFTPDVGLVENTIYTVTIDKSAKGLDGKEMIFDYPFAFTTREPPRVLWTIPENGVINVDPATAIRIMFSEPMQRETGEDAFSIVPDVSGRFSWPEDSLMVFTPDVKLDENTVYTVTIGKSAKNLDDSEMIFDYHFGFFVPGPGPGPEPPWVLSTIPENGAIDADPATEIRITFSKPMDRVPTQDAFSIVPFVSGSFSWPEDSLMVFTPDVELDERTVYTVKIDKSAKDLAGNEMIFTYRFDFFVSPPKSPWVVSTFPENGAIDVDPDTQIRITFSEAMQRGTAEDAFSIDPDVSGSFSWENSSRMVFTPDVELDENTGYTVTIDKSAKDLDGNEMIFTTYQFGFSTGERPRVLSTLPGRGATNVDPATEIRIAFSESMQLDPAEGAFSIAPDVSGSFSWEHFSRMVFTPDVGLVEGTIYTVMIDKSAKDLDGNEMISDYRFDFITEDGTPPEIFDIEIRQCSAFIEWKTDEPTMGIVQYGTQSGVYDSVEVADSAWVTTHRIELRNLALETTYYYVVLSTDRRGNQSQSAEYTLRVSILNYIEITPAFVVLKPGEHMTFSVQGYDAGGNKVSVHPLWEVKGSIGTIDSAGTFVAGGTSGSGEVVVSAQAVFGNASAEEISASAKVVVRAVPKAYALYPNYPNPFNPSTTIRYALPKASTVWLAVYNLRGQRVRVLDQQIREAGEYAKTWDGRDEDGREVASGVYIVQMVASTHPKRLAFSAARRMVLVR